MIEGSLTVVIAEENKQIQEMISEHFNKSNSIKEVKFVRDGKELYNTILETLPDVVVMDLLMKEKDGFSVLKDINDLQMQKKPKFLILTAFNSDQFITEALKLGASYIMAKPFDVDLLEQRICSIKDSTLSTTSAANEAIKADADKFMPVVKDSKLRALEEKITNIFITVGIPAHIKGYQFLREAIKMAINSPEIINSITKKLYPSIAALFSTSPSKVERAIRHAIEVAWNRGKIENINSIFGVKVYSSNDKPTNGEFIALVADKMLLEGA